MRREEFAAGTLRKPFTIGLWHRPKDMGDLLTRLHPSVIVRVARDELHVTGATEFRAAPVI